MDGNIVGVAERERHDGARERHGCPHADCAAEQREQKAFGEHLSHDARA